jgi:Na+/phosphate symporter
MFWSDVCRYTTIDDEESVSIVAAIDGLISLAVQGVVMALSARDFLGAALAEACVLPTTIGTTTMIEKRIVAARERRTRRTKLMASSLILLIVLGRIICPSASALIEYLNSGTRCKQNWD